MIEPLTVITLVSLAISLIGAAVTYFNLPKQNQQENSAQGIDQVNMPTVDVNNKLPVIFGRARVRQPNVIWWGDWEGRAGSGENPPTYHAGIYAVVGLGPLNLHAIFADDIAAWTGFRNSNVYYSDITINRQFLFSDSTANRDRNGIHYYIHYFTGRVVAPGSTVNDPCYDPEFDTFLDSRAVGSPPPVNMPQLADTYLRKYWRIPTDSQIPNYEAMSRLLFYGPSKPATVNTANGYYGASPSPKNYNFIVSRYPYRLHYDVFGTYAYLPNDTRPNPDPDYPNNPVLTNWTDRISITEANPAEIIYDILTSNPITDGYGLGLTNVNKYSFAIAAALFESENFGLSFVWPQDTTALDIIAKVCEIVSAVVYCKVETDQWIIKPFRAQQQQQPYWIFDKSNISDMDTVELNAESDLINEVVVKYTDGTNAVNPYAQEEMSNQNIANITAQNMIQRKEFDYYMISRRDLARRIAYRELLRATAAHKTLEIEILRKAMIGSDSRNSILSIGDEVLVVWPSLGINERFRVFSITLGPADDNKVGLRLVQDMYTSGLVDAESSGGYLDNVVLKSIPTLKRPVGCCYLEGPCWDGQAHIVVLQSDSDKQDADYTTADANAGYFVMSPPFEIETIDERKRYGLYDTLSGGGITAFAKQWIGVARVSPTKAIAFGRYHYVGGSIYGDKTYTVVTAVIDLSKAPTDLQIISASGVYVHMSNTLTSQTNARSSYGLSMGGNAFVFSAYASIITVDFNGVASYPNAFNQNSNHYKELNSRASHAIVTPQNQSSTSTDTFFVGAGGFSYREKDSFLSDDDQYAARATVLGVKYVGGYLNVYAYGAESWRDPNDHIINGEGFVSCATDPTDKLLVAIKETGNGFRVWYRANNVLWSNSSNPGGQSYGSFNWHDTDMPSLVYGVNRIMWVNDGFYMFGRDSGFIFKTNIWYDQTFGIAWDEILEEPIGLPQVTCGCFYNNNKINPSGSAWFGWSEVCPRKNVAIILPTTETTDEQS